MAVLDGVKRELPMVVSPVVWTAATKQKMRGGESRAADGAGAFAWWNKPAGALRPVGSKSLLARLVLEVATLQDTHDVARGHQRPGLRERSGR